MNLFESAADLFGLQFKKKDLNKELSGALSTGHDDEGATNILSTAASGSFGTYLDQDGQMKSEAEAIRKYREISLFAEVDVAIQEIVNEAIPQEQETKLIDLNLDDLDMSDSIKEKITNEFNTVLNLLKYSEHSADLFLKWYVDGRIAFQIIVDKNDLTAGIQELVLLNVQNIKKMKEITTKRTADGATVIDKVDEYFIYNENAAMTSRGASIQQSSAGLTPVNSVKISNDAIIYCTSGIVDNNSGMVLSYLHKAIRPINQLRMLEDATVVYFIARAPERRVFYVDVGNLPKLKAEQYLKDIMNRYRNKMVYDARTGEVKNDKKYMCLAMDTQVPLLDGRTLSISEIAAEKDAGKELWAYSCDPVTGEFVPGVISWAGVTRKDAQVMKLTLDNGKSVICTPDHKFPVWNKGFVEAKDLIIGESMIPHYTKTATLIKDKSRNVDYHQTFRNETGTWEFTHRLVSKWKDSVGLDNEFLFNEEYADNKKLTVHHKNINRFDNTPENLVRMNAKDHIEWHKKNSKTAGIAGGIKGRKILADLMQDEEWNAWFRSQQVAGWTDEKKKVASNHAKKNNLSERGNAYLVEQYKDKNSDLSKNHVAKYNTEYPQSVIDALKSCAKNKNTVAETVDAINSMSTLINEYSSLNSSKVMSGQKDYSKINRHDVSRISKSLGFNGFSQLKESLEFRNHKIVKIEYLHDRIDTGCLTIDGDETYNSHHTFALSIGIYTRNSMLEDFWMPRRDGGKGTEITSLPGAQNVTGYLDSLSWFKEKMYESLSIPKGRLQQETGFTLGQSQTITRDEVKFQKFIDRLRNKFGQVIYDALKVQLQLKGICNQFEWDNEIKSFLKLDFQKDNYFSELKNQELMTSRFTMVQQLDNSLQKYVSKEWVQKNVLMLSDEDIEQMSKEIAAEKDDETCWPDWKLQGQVQMDQQQDMMQQQQAMQPSPFGQPSQPAGSDQEETQNF